MSRKFWPPAYRFPLGHAAQSSHNASRWRLIAVYHNVTLCSASRVNARGKKLDNDSS